MHGEHAAGAARRRRERRLRRRHGPGRVNTPRSPTGTEDGQGPGGYEMHDTAKFRKNPPPRSPARGTLGSTMTTACRSSEAPDQTGSFPCLVRRTSRQLVEVFKIADMMVPDVEQVIVVPKIALEDEIPRRGELRELRVVDLRRDMPRLVEVKHRTAMEVLRWCSHFVRRGVAITSEERYCMLLLMPDYGWRAVGGDGG